MTAVRKTNNVAVLPSDKVVFSSETWRILEATTREDAIQYGRKSWCTAEADNYAYQTSYSPSKGRLFIFFKKDHARPSYQLFVSHNQEFRRVEFRNAGNDYVNRADFLKEWRHELLEFLVSLNLNEETFGSFTRAGIDDLHFGQVSGFSFYQDAIGRPTLTRNRQSDRGLSHNEFTAYFIDESFGIRERAFMSRWAASLREPQSSFLSLDEQQYIINMEAVQAERDLADTLGRGHDSSIADRLRRDLVTRSLRIPLPQRNAVHDVVSNLPPSKQEYPTAMVNVIDWADTVRRIVTSQLDRPRSGPLIDFVENAIELPNNGVLTGQIAVIVQSRRLAIWNGKDWTTTEYPRIDELIKRYGGYDG